MITPMRDGQDPSEPAFTRPERAATTPAVTRRRAGAGLVLARLGLALLLGYIGALTLTAAGAAAVKPLVENSPTLAWLYNVFGVVGAARVIGVVELVAAALLVAGVIAHRAAVVGSLLAVATFVTTLSFLATTPGVFVDMPGFPIPAPSALAAFLMKDVFLLGIAAWSLIHATRALRRPRV